MIYQYTKSPVNLEVLEASIKASNITIAINNLSSMGGLLSIDFKSELSEAEVTTLTTLVTNHVYTAPAVSSMPVTIDKHPPFSDACGHRFRGAKTSVITIPANSSATVYTQIAESRKIDGGEIVTSAFSFGNWGKMWVEDKDGVYYPAGTILDTFVGGWYLNPSNFTTILLAYPACIPAGLYVGIECYNVGDSDISFAANLYLHKGA
jgi:hypothetical protein